MTEPTDSRLDWCRRKIAGFAEFHDKSLAARRDTQASYDRYKKDVKPIAMVKKDEAA